MRKREPFSAYHGHLISTMQISPYKFDHGSSIPKPDFVHVVSGGCISFYRIMPYKYHLV